MELKAGYKQTEVGAIPVDWNAKTLGDVMVHCFSGATPSRSRPDFYKGNIRWITSGELNYNVIEDTAEKISKEAVIRTNLKVLPKNTFLMAITGLEAEGTRGSCGIVGEESTTNQSCMAIFPTDELLTEYLFQYYVFKGKSLALKYCQGTKQQSYTAKIVKILPIPLPSIDEQRAIAFALSDVDTLIAALDRLIAKKRDIKQAAMQELLTGKRRLPGFSGKWKMRLLGELSEMGSGGTPPSSNSAFYGGGIPWVSISDMTKCGKFISTTDRTLSAEGLINSAAQMFPKCTVLYAMYASLGECSIAEVSLCSSQAILGIRVRAELNNEFLYYHLTSVKTQVKKMGQQGTQANLNKGMVQRFQLLLPSIPEQTAIVSVISDMDDEIASLEARREKTCALKQGMMQELLTGRIRLIKGAQS